MVPIGLDRRTAAVFVLLSDHEHFVQANAYTQLLWISLVSAAPSRHISAKSSIKSRCAGQFVIASYSLF